MNRIELRDKLGAIIRSMGYEVQIAGVKKLSWQTDTQLISGSRLKIKPCRLLRFARRCASV